MVEVVKTVIPPTEVSVPWDVTIGTPSGYVSETYPSREEFVARGGPSGAVDRARDIETRRQAELAKQRVIEEQAKQAREQARQQIAAESFARRQQAIANLRESTRTAVGIQGRAEAQRQFQQELQLNQAIAQAKRVEAGVIPTAQVAGITITPQNAPIVLKGFTGQQITEPEAAQLQQLGFDIERQQITERVPAVFERIPRIEKRDFRDDSISARINRFISRFLKPKPAPWAKEPIQLTPEQLQQMQQRTAEIRRVSPFKIATTISTAIGEPLARTRIGQAFEKVAKESRDISINPITGLPQINILGPTSQVVMRGITEAGPTFAFFGPAIQTGVAAKDAKARAKIRAKTRQKAVQRTKKAIKKATTEDIEAVEAGIRTARFNNRMDLVRQAYRKVLKGGSPQTIKDTETVLRKALGDLDAQDLINQVRRSEGLSQVAIAGQPKTKIVTETLFTDPVQLKGAAETISAFAGTGLYERTMTPEEQFVLAKQAQLRKVQAIRPEPTSPLISFVEPTNILEGTKPRETVGLGIMVSPLVPSAEATRIQEETKARQEAKARQREAVIPGLRQPLPEAVAEIPRAATIPISIPTVVSVPKTIQRPRTTFGFGFPFPKPIIKAKPKFVPIIPLIPLPTTKRKRPARIMRIGKDTSFFAEVKRKGKWKPVSTPLPFLRAKQVGRRKVQRTLAASFRIRGARTGKIIPLVPQSPEFRRGKKDPFALVERRRFRLSTKSEVLEIKRAKRRKQKSVNFFK